MAKDCNDYMDGGKSTTELMAKVNNALDVRLSKQHNDFSKNYRFIAFYGNDFYGIGKDTFNGVPGYNAVNTALYDREKYNLPKEWIPFYFLDDGYMAYLDYGHLNNDGEPQVIAGIYTGQKYEMSEVIAEDLGDFLLQKVEEQLANQ